MLLLAGCLGPAADEGTEVTAGQAYNLAGGLVSYENGEPRFRVPGTSGHDSAKFWLQDAAQVPGWTVSMQEFSGADYQALEANDTALSGWQSSCEGDDAAQVAQFNFTNIVARYDNPSSDTQILLGAHWESKEDANRDPDPSKRGEPVLGANDGASGVGVLLSIMRDHVPAGDITVVFFDGEDGFEDCHPLAGSMYYARTMTDVPDAMLLLDMVGDADAKFPLEYNSGLSGPELQQILWDNGREKLPAAFVDVQRSVYDDHIPFIQEGVPSVDLIHYAEGFPSYWHTTEDTMDKLDSQFMDDIQYVIQGTLNDWFQAQTP
jgi:hypothetical protein